MLMSTELEKYIQSSFGVTRTELQSIGSFFQPVALKKNDYYLKAGHYSDRLGFVQSGIVREFLDSNQQETTKWLITKGYFMVDLSGFLFDKPARVNLQALTDCEVYAISKADYTRIGQVVPRWPEIEKFFLARCFTVLEDRIITHLSMSAEERYAQFFQFAPDLFNQVPLQYLASLLGMTPETFSRIRKKQSGRTS